jgi:ankyrin repeat protein
MGSPWVRMHAAIELLFFCAHYSPDPGSILVADRWCRVEQLSNALSPKVKPLIVAQSRSSVVTFGPTGLFAREWYLAPVGEGDFTVDSDRLALRPFLESLIEARKASALAQGDLLWFRNLHALRAWLLVGTGDVAVETSLSEWMAAMRFESVKDGAKTGMTPLRFAVIAGRADLCKELLEQGADIEAPLKKKHSVFKWMKGQTILHSAAGIATSTTDEAHNANSKEIVRLLLEHGADPFKRAGDQGTTPLMIAEVVGNLAAIDLIMEHAPLVVTTPIAKFGQMVWEMWAVFGGHPRVFAHLLQKYPERMAAAVSSSHAGDRFGMSLVVHLLNNAADVATLEALLDAGCTTDGIQRDAKGKPVGPAGRATAGDIKMLYRLVDALTLRASKPQSNFVEFWAYSCRCAPLHAAVHNANLGAVDVLIKRGADPNSTYHPKRMTPLALAVMGGHVEIAMHLLAAGARPGAKDARSRSCERWARARGHKALANMLAELVTKGVNGDATKPPPSMAELRAAAEMSQIGAQAVPVAVP